MMEINAADVKKLRDRTGMQMMKCKAALTEAGGDMEKAVEILRKRTRTRQDKTAEPRDRRGPHRRSHRPGQERRRPSSSCAASRPRSPRTSMFVKLANDLAKQVAVQGAGRRPRRCWPSRSSTTPRRRSTTASPRSSA